MLSIKVWPCFVVNTVYLWCSLQWGLNPDYNVAMLLQPHLSDGLTPIWIDPERSRLDHFLRVYLGNGPLHLVYQSPAGWGGEGRCSRGQTPITLGLFFVRAAEAARQIGYSPPHLRSCPCLAAWLELRRRHTSRQCVSRRAASIILPLNAHILASHRKTNKKTKTFK